LNLSLTDSGGNQTAAGLDDLLFDETAFTVGKGLIFAQADDGSLGDTDPLNAAHFGVGAQQELDLALQRDVEGVDLDRGAVLAHVRDRETQIHAAVRLHQRAGTRNPHGQACHAINLFFG
jgi:hypothetical protein